MFTKDMMCQDIILSIGDQQITGKDAIVTSFDISCDNNLEPLYAMGSNELIGMLPTQQSFHITIELECTNMETIGFLNGKEAKKVSKKIVSECSTRELLFAIREKVKRGEKNDK